MLPHNCCEQTKALIEEPLVRVPIGLFECISQEERLVYKC
jgi:hypothetical protein